MSTTVIQRTPWRIALVEAIEEGLYPGLPLVVAAVLYSMQLGAAPLWYDEAGSAWMAELPLSRLIAATAGDTHPPLYFLLLSAWQHLLGSTPVVMRLPSLLCALLVFWLAHRIAVDLKLSTLARLIAVTLLMLSPFQLHFAQEARMYSLLQVEVLLMIWCVLHRRWPWFALASSAALWTHNYALFYLAAIGAWAFGRELLRPGLIDSKTDAVRWDTQIMRLMLAGLLAVASWLPWAWVLREQMQTVANGYWIQPVTPGSVVYVLYTWLFGFTLAEWMQPTGVLVASGLIVWLSVKALRERSEGLTLLYLVAAPVAAVVIVSIVWKPILLFRGFAPGVPLLYLLIGWGFSRITFTHRLYALAIVTPLLVTGVVGHYVWNVDHKTGIQPAEAIIRAGWQPGDVIIHANEGTLMELHNTTRDLPQYILPRCAQPNLGALSPATQQALGMEVVPDTLTWSRAWFVWSWPPTVTQCEVDQARAFLRTYDSELALPIRNDDYVEANLWLVTK